MTDIMDVAVRRGSVKDVECILRLGIHVVPEDVEAAGVHVTVVKSELERRQDIFHLLKEAQEKQSALL